MKNILVAIDFSNATDAVILFDAAYERCEDILSRDQKHLIAVAEFLLAHETMSAEEFEAVFTDETVSHDKI